MAESVCQKDCSGGGKVIVATLGCRLNQTESEAIARRYSDASFEVTQEVPTASSAVMQDVSLVIVNTCAVTQKAEQKARRTIRLLLQKCPNAAIVVTGCYAALNASEIEKIDNRITVRTKETYSQFPFTSTFAAHSRASLKIQDGCNMNCAFCTVHIARGKSVSLPLDEAVRRAQAIEANGYGEVTLTGVNIGQYNCGNGNLSYLLDALLKGTKSLCFRLSSLHPDAIDKEFCRVISNERVRPHFHLSVQSGSSKVLRAMARGYGADDVRRAVNEVREHKENPFIACDMITGFPAESEADFADTVRLCRECGFAHIHAFPFSMRQGTAACKMRPLVPQSVAGERVKILEEISEKCMDSYVETCTGKVFSAIAESPVRKDGTFCDLPLSPLRHFRAVTENFLHVIVPFPAPLPRGSIRPCGLLANRQGEAIRVRIIGRETGGADATAVIAD